MTSASRSPQYSDAFVDWIVGEHGADSDFFEQTKASYRNARRM